MCLFSCIFKKLKHISCLSRTVGYYFEGKKIVCGITEALNFCSELVVFVSSERERNVLFNDTLNTFYLRLYGVRHMVKDHSDSEKGNPLPPHRLLLSINSKGSFICTIPQTG